MWIGREDLNYNGIVISNNSLTGKGSKVQCQVHRHINGNKSDTVGERYLSGSMMVQTLVEDKGTNYSYAPRMALTFKILTHRMGNASAVTNIFIDGGRLSGYSSFALPEHEHNLVK